MSSSILDLRRWLVFSFCIGGVTALGASLEADFLQAVQEDLREAAVHLLDAGARFEVADGDGTTVLMWAARHGNITLVEKLLAKGAEPRRARPDGYTVVMAAAESGDGRLFDLVSRRVGFGAPVTTRGYSLLLAAARGGNTDLFNRVRQRDPDFERVTDEGYSLLMAAAEGGESAIFATVRQRLNLRENLFSRPATGETMLHFAAEGGSPVIMQDLLNDGLKVVLDARNLGGETPLLIAARRGRSTLVRLLLENGADPAISDIGGRAPLHHGAARGDRAVTAILLAAGADANISDNQGHTPTHSVLHYMITAGFVRPYSRMEERKLVEAEETLRLLLVRGGDPKRADRAGETPAHVLARSRFPELVPMLRAAGAEFGARCAAGHTPLDLARVAGYPPMIRVLESLVPANFGE